MTEVKFEKAKGLRARIKELNEQVVRVKTGDKLMLRINEQGLHPYIDLPQQYLEIVKAKYIMYLQDEIKRLEREFDVL